MNAIDPWGLYFIPLQARPFIDKEKRAFENISRVLSARAYEATGCIVCTVNCSYPIFISETSIQRAQRAVEKAAKELAKEWIKKAVTFTGLVSRGSSLYSAYNVIKCFIKCKNK